MSPTTVWQKHQEINRVMSKMGKSFIFGIVVASITWSISLYLYWTLVHNNENISASEHGAAISEDMQSKSDGSISLNSLDNDSRKYHEKSKHSNKNLYLDKVERYRKEKKYRKIGQKLADELRPKVIDFSGKQWTIASANFIISISRLDDIGMVKNPEEQYLRDIGYKRHAFNILVSGNLGLSRAIPDTRHKL